MYVVFAEELDATSNGKGRVVQTLEKAFAQIACRCGLNYHFEHEHEEWRLVFTAVERPDRSPESVHTDYRRPRDAKYDLIAQAVDGRLRGHTAVSYDDFQKRRRAVERTQASAAAFAT